jgi:hypothetical protein
MPKPSELDNRVGHDVIGMVDFQVVARARAAEVIDADGDVADRIVRRFVAACEHPLSRGLMIRLAKGCIGDARGAGRRSSAMTRFAFARISAGSRAELSMLRTELVMIQLAGMAITRYGLELEPMASLSVDELIAVVTPSVRAALNSDTVVDVAPIVAGEVVTGWREPDARVKYKMTGRFS